MVSNCPGGNYEILGNYLNFFTYEINKDKNKTISFMINKFNQINQNKINYKNYLDKLSEKLSNRHNSKKIFSQYLQLINE